MREICESLKTEVRAEYDVIVAGGGVAGAAAALAARRLGARVLLVEKSMVLGGLATLGLINYYEPLCDGRGKVMVSGLGRSLMDLSMRYGFDTLSDVWKDKNAAPGEADPRLCTVYSPAIFSLALNELLIESGVELRYDMLAASPVMREGRLEALIVESKSGREAFGARMLVDATGDADILYRAGVPCVLGSNFFTYIAHGCDLDSVARCHETGDMRYLRAQKYFIGSNLRGDGHPEGMRHFTGVTNEDVSEYNTLGQRFLLDRIKSGERTEREIITLPGMAQFRTTRRIAGEYTLTGGDEGARFEDSVGATGDFRHRGARYEVPFRCLYNHDFGNLLAAGRCVSAEGDGWEVARVIPTAVMTGEAAGTAAALCCRENVDLNALDGAQLQNALAQFGVETHVD